MPISRRISTLNEEAARAYDAEARKIHGQIKNQQTHRLGEDDVDFEADFQELNKTGIESVDEARSPIHFA
jgi:hypothetical protein